MSGQPFNVAESAEDARAVNDELRRHMTPEMRAFADAPPPVIAPSKARIAAARERAKGHGLVLRKVRGFEDAFELIHDATNTVVCGDTDGTGAHETLVEIEAYLVGLGEPEVICRHASSRGKLNFKREMTKEEAEYAAEDIRERKGEALDVYECPKEGADHYHIGHTPS